MKKAKLQRIRIYGSIYNALTLTSYPGLDPEVNTNISQGARSLSNPGARLGFLPSRPFIHRRY